MGEAKKLENEILQTSHFQKGTSLKYPSLESQRPSSISRNTREETVHISFLVLLPIILGI